MSRRRPARGRSPVLGLFALFALFAMAGGGGAPASGADASRLVEDATGASVSLPARPARVISLAPDLTETLFALGAGDSVVGVSDACDRPEAARALAQVGPMIQPSVERILALRPDLVLATSQGNPLQVLERLRSLGITVVGLSPAGAGLDGVVLQLRQVALAVGRPEEGERLATAFEARRAAVARDAAGLPRLRACCLVWTDPIIGAGPATFLHEVLALAGVDDACARGPAEYPNLSAEEVLLAAPQLLVLATGGPPEEAGSSLPEWASALEAVSEGRVLVLDDRFLRPTVRLMEAGEWLVAWRRAGPWEPAATKAPAKP